MSAKIIKKQQGVYAIEGELNMQTVPDASRLLTELMQKLAAEPESLTIDLAAVSRSDSAGVALLIDAMQVAKMVNLTLLFSNLPQQMQDIAGISDLLKILPISKH
jgi:phospholipid transport system transporter-binding protein